MKSLRTCPNPDKGTPLEPGKYTMMLNLYDRTSLINEHFVDDFIIPFAVRHHDPE